MPSLNLVDAATLLMQLEATDTADLAMLCEALTDLAIENRVPNRAQPFVARAARVLGTIVNGTAPDLPAAFADVSRAIEEAMCASEGIVSPPTVVTTTAPTPQHPVSTDRHPDDADRELLPDFITEGNECAGHLKATLLQLEKSPDDEEAVNTVFRAFHTAKGTSAFLRLSRRAAFAYQVESLLSRVRDKAIAYAKGCADLSLRSVDMLKALLVSVETGLNGDGTLPIPPGYRELLAALAGYDPARETNDIFPPPTAAVAAAVSATSPTVAAPDAGTSTANASKARVESNADATIRVSTGRLDRLIDMVGELVIAQSMIAGHDLLSAGTQNDLLRKVTHAGKIVRGPRDLSMSMRMVPLRATFQRLTRVVRDTASKVGKTVQFVTDGDDVEIDRNMVDV